MALANLNPNPFAPRDPRFTPSGRFQGNLTPAQLAAKDKFQRDYDQYMGWNAANGGLNANKGFNPYRSLIPTGNVSPIIRPPGWQGGTAGMVAPGSDAYNAILARTTNRGTLPGVTPNFAGALSQGTPIAAPIPIATPQQLANVAGAQTRTANSYSQLDQTRGPITYEMVNGQKIPRRSWAPTGSFSPPLGTM